MYATLARARANALQAASASQTTRDSSVSDLAFWDAIKHSTNGADFAAYLEQFPNGAFAPLAQVRLAQSRQAGAEAEAQANAVDPTEAAFWRSVVASDQPSDYQAYIETYPGGEFIDDARARLRTLILPPPEPETTLGEASTEIATVRTQDEKSNKPWQTASEIRALLIGNGARLTGLGFNDTPWREEFEEGGIIRGTERIYRYTGSRWFEGDMLCFDYRGTDNDGCWYLAIEGDRTMWWDRNGNASTGDSKVTYLRP